MASIVNHRGKVFRRVFKICRPCHRADGRRRRAENPERARKMNRRWAEKPENRQWLINYCKEWRRKNPEKSRAGKQSWRARNPDKNRKLGRDYYWRHKNEPWHVVCRRTRARLVAAVSNRETNKYKNTMDLVGCDRNELVSHIQSTFSNGMSWDNYGSWEIDHVKPCASFDLTDLEQQRRCFHFTNLQALWSKENRSKGAKNTHA